MVDMLTRMCCGTLLASLLVCMGFDVSYAEQGVERGNPRTKAATVTKLSPEKLERVSQRYAEGMTLLYDGKIQEALRIFRKLREVVDVPEIVLREAECRSQLGDVEEARRLLTKLLGEHPEHSEAKALLASLARVSDAGESLALAGKGERPPRKAGQVARGAQGEEKERQRLRTYSSLRQDIFWDSNINAAPDRSEITSPTGNTYVLSEKNRELDDWASQTFLYGWLSYDLGAPGRFFLEGSSSFYHLHYFEHDEYDASQWRINLGPVWRGQKTVMRLDGGYRLYFDDGSRGYEEFSIDPSLTLRISPRMRVQLETSWAHRSHEEARHNDLDRDSFRASLIPSFYFDEGKTRLYFSLSGLDVDADNDHFDYQGAEFGLGVSRRINTKLLASLDYERRQIKYERTYSGWLVDREDDRDLLRFSLRYDITERLALGASFSWTDNDSNVELYDYERYTTGINAQFRF
ncbi:MAG: porin family protein [Desulfobulbus sp.]